MFREFIARTIKDCESARAAGAARERIRDLILPEKVRELERDSSLQKFLSWAEEDREFSSYYYEALQSGVCAKPPEVAAMILEEIISDALD